MSATRKRVAILSPLGMNWLVQRGQILLTSNSSAMAWSRVILNHGCFSCHTPKLWLWRRNVDQIIPWISNKTNPLKSLQTCISFIKKKSQYNHVFWLESRYWDSNYCAKVLIGNSLGTRTNGRRKERLDARLGRDLVSSLVKVNPWVFRSWTRLSTGERLGPWYPCIIC